MTLTTHATAASAIAFFVPSPWALGLALSFASHFVLDMIPHYDYHLYSHDHDHQGIGLKINHRRLTLDILRVGLDALLGLIIAGALAYYLQLSIFYLLACAAFAMLPDFLQFIYGLMPLKILTPLQTFHSWIHCQRKIKGPILGFGQQLVLNLIIISGLFIHS